MEQEITNYTTHIKKAYIAVEQPATLIHKYEYNLVGESNQYHYYNYSLAQTPHTVERYLPNYNCKDRMLYFVGNGCADTEVEDWEDWTSVSGYPPSILKSGFYFSDTEPVPFGYTANWVDDKIQLQILNADGSVSTEEITAGENQNTFVWKCSSTKAIQWNETAQCWVAPNVEIRLYIYNNNDLSDSQYKSFFYTNVQLSQYYSVRTWYTYDLNITINDFETDNGIVYDGTIYAGGTISEMQVGHAEEVTIQSDGEGTYQLYGRVADESEYQPLSLIDVSTYQKTKTLQSGCIYYCDIMGLYSIVVKNVKGNIDNIYTKFSIKRR